LRAVQRAAGRGAPLRGNRATPRARAREQQGAASRAAEEAKCMSIIHIVRQHTLTLVEAKAEVERIAERVDSEFGADYAWDGDTLSFWRSGVSGQITVTEEALDLSIKLGLLLTAVKGQIERQIADKVDETLAARGALAPPDPDD
jgi:putative polyhydroxyalkanoate system protein